MRRILPDLTDAKTYAESKTVDKKKVPTGRVASGLMMDDAFDITLPDIYEDQPIVVKGVPSGTQKVRVAEGGNVRGRRGDFLGVVKGASWIAVGLSEFQKNWTQQV